MRKKRETKQFNVRLTPRTIALLNAAADKLELTQGELIEKAVDIIARHKKVTLPEAEAS